MQIRDVSRTMESNMRLNGVQKYLFEMSILRCHFILSSTDNLMAKNFTRKKTWLSTSLSPNNRIFNGKWEKISIEKTRSHILSALFEILWFLFHWILWKDPSNTNSEHLSKASIEHRHSFSKWNKNRVKQQF